MGNDLISEKLKKQLTHDWLLLYKNFCRVFSPGLYSGLVELHQRIGEEEMI